MFVHSSNTVKKHNPKKAYKKNYFCVEFVCWDEDRHWEHIVRSSVNPEMLNNTQLH